MTDHPQPQTQTDEPCHHCHDGKPEPIAVKTDRIVWRCPTCEHVWNIERSIPLIEFVDGWVRFNSRRYRPE